MESSEGQLKSLDENMMPRDELWCLYMLDKEGCLGASDQTLELHMEELDEERMKVPALYYHCF